MGELRVVEPGSSTSAADQVGRLEEQVANLEAENARLRQLLNDPHRLLQRGLRLLSGTVPRLR